LTNQAVQQDRAPALREDLKVSKRIRLNPCDFLFYGQHQLLTRRSPEGNIAYMIFDVEDAIDPDQFLQALSIALARHPSMMAKFRVSFPLGRPYWKTPSDSASRAIHAARAAHSFHDLRGNADWESQINRLYPSGKIPQWDLRAGPQIRFEQYALPNGHTRFIFRWPHFLMDADGAQWFLLQISRAGSGKATCSEYPDSISRDEEGIDVLKSHSFIDRLRLFRRGMAAQKSNSHPAAGRLFKMPDQPLAEHEVIHRNYSVDQTIQIQEAAKHSAPSGPALYARYSAACILRAIDRLFQENAAPSEAYFITMPLRAAISQHDARLFAKRPVPGNYLVTPVLCGRRDRLRSMRTIGDDILKQFQEYVSQEIDMAQWSMMWAASFIHEWSYKLIFKLPLDIAEFASGFSYYGEISEPVRTICGARVLNLWGGGPTTTPPALNPVFSKFENRLNMTMTYDKQVVSDQVAQRYVELIEEHLFDSPTLDETIRL
jgi:hypothetical protein